MNEVERINKKLGFGLMRLPMKDGEVDIEQTCLMVDEFIKAGFNYFDTAHGYLSGESEKAAKTCLTSRYPRESFILTNKLTDEYFKTNDDIRHFGISFHDRAEVLDAILSEYPQIEVVQIQFNYLDYDDIGVQSRKCYEVCRKHNKPVLVMEPVKGGSLVKLPDEAQRIFASLNGGSPASYAIRFAAGFPGMLVVLSGMSSIEQLRDNISYMSDFKPLDKTETEAVEKVRGVYKGMELIPCTACRYCTDGCPKHIAIPDLFALMNAKQLHRDWNANYYYSNVHTAPGRRASDCIKCGKCEGSCPQNLPIRKLLADVAAEFEKADGNDD